MRNTQDALGQVMANCCPDNSLLDLTRYVDFTYWGLVTELFDVGGYEECEVRQSDPEVELSEFWGVYGMLPGGEWESITDAPTDKLAKAIVRVLKATREAQLS